MEIPEDVNKLESPPDVIKLDDSLVTPEDLALVSLFHRKKADENLSRIMAERAKSEIVGNTLESVSPENLLIQLADLGRDYMLASTEAFAKGDFDDPNRKLVIQDNCVVLVRHASDSEHLVKSGKTASPEEMRDSSLSQAGAPDAGAVHTSANVDNVEYAYSRYPIYGEFRIPVSDFIRLAQEHKIILGNVGEAEVVLSGDVALEYLTKIVEKPK